MPGKVAAQTGFRFTDAAPGGEVERYLRGLQALGEVPLAPWSVRSPPYAIGAVGVPASPAHPWAGRLQIPEREPGSVSFAWVNPRVDFVFNSALPLGQAAGGVWTGRGATVAAAAGFRARAGPVYLEVVPEAAWAENREFTLAPSSLGYRHAAQPNSIDLPQRFGDESVGTVGLGQSTLGVDLRRLSAGLSSARQHWGPGIDMPLLVGPGAPGFVHAFLGTSRPVCVGVGSLHGRLVWGRLEQSEFSPMPADSARRLVSGVLAVFVPRGVEGLEIGLGRIIHEPLPETFDPSHVGKPFGGIFAERTENTVANQVASIFFRWVFPSAGFDVYGEHVREDFSYNLRDFWLNPDLNAGHLLGARKVWRRSTELHAAVRAEVFAGRSSLGSPAGFVVPVYVHTEMRQGHTHRGQLLGAPAALGGAGASVAADVYHRRGRWTAAWTREQRGERPFHLGEERNSNDVVHTVRVEGLRFQGEFALRAALEASYNLNRDFQDDVFNLGLRLGLQARVD